MPLYLPAKHELFAFICNEATWPELSRRAKLQSIETRTDMWSDTSNIQKCRKNEKPVEDFLDRIESLCREKRVTHLVISKEITPTDQQQVSLRWLTDEINKRLRQAKIRPGLKVVEIKI